jgi:hypothetical protein
MNSALPDSGWAWAYFAGLVLTLFIAGMGKRFDQRLFLVLLGNWFVSRLTFAFAPENFAAWVVIDFMTITAFMLLFSRASLVCAGLFVIPLNFDLYGLFYETRLEATSAVWEGVGYVSMLVMTGASFDGTRTIFRLGRPDRRDNLRRSVLGRVSVWRLGRTGD